MDKVCFWLWVYCTGRVAPGGSLGEHSLLLGATANSAGLKLRPLPPAQASSPHRSLFLLEAVMSGQH